MSYNGVVAEKRKASEQTYLKSLGTYVSGFSSYIPSGLKKQLSSTQPHDERDKVIWVGFDNYEKGGKSRQCLLLSFVNGFQIWDIQDQPDLICELVSKREGAIKCFKFLQTPPEGTPKGRLTDKHPLIALASAEDSAKFAKTAVKLYSLREQDYINTMRFRSEVYSILCSKRMLVVALHDHIYGFDIVNMNKIFSRPYHPQDPQFLPQMRAYGRSSPSMRTKPSSPSSLIALGPRWLAYPGKKVQSIKDEDPTSNTMDQLVEAAKYLSDVGYKTMSSYFSPESQPAGPAAPALTPEDLANFGNVIVHDVCTGKTVAHFRAHKEPLSYLAFDPSGTLLVTAGAGGYEFNIFQIRPSSGALHENALPLYTLVRGRTSAAITDITFSNDSRWMAVSTSHGTTHIYAINPEGGPVNIHTHIPSEPIASHEAPFIFNHPLNPKHMVLSVVERIKQAGLVPEENTTHQPTTAAMITSTPSKMKILVVTHAGILNQYNLRPHGPAPGPDVDPKTLQLTVEPTFYWDVCRRSSWPQLLTRVKSKKAEPADGQPTTKPKEKSSKDPSWLSNVEICTHTPHFRPLWAGPQFTFKTYRKPAHGTLTLSHQLMEPIHEESKIEAKHKPGGTTNSGVLDPSAWGPAEMEEGVPSGSMGRELKDHINQAISTPMRFAEKKTEMVLIDSLVGDYKNGLAGKGSSSSSSSASSSGLGHDSPTDKKKSDNDRPHDSPPLRMDPNPQNLYSYDDEDY